MNHNRSIAARTAIVAAVAVTALLLSACSTGTTKPTSTPSSGNSALTALAATVAASEKAGKTYPVPTAPISGVSALAGKTVYFIPISEQASQFVVTGAALTQALAAANIKVDICNGNANPSAINGCIAQATAAKAGAIIADSIPYGLGFNAFTAARKAGIPVLITDQIPDSTAPADATLGYLQGPATPMIVAAAKWIIVDSKGKANVLINETTDNPSTQAYIKTVQALFASDCAGCTVSINLISSANFPLIASSTSAALLKTAGINYVFPEFEEYVQPTYGAVQASGKATSVKGVTSAAQIGGLQMLQSGTFLYADAGQASAYQGWADADAALRLMTKTTLPTYTIPIRLFTRQNVGSVALTTDAEASGEWFGPTNFTSQFKTLWGVN
jgi:ribose transport system substrate-binding protein